MKICSFFAQIHHLQSDFITKRTNVLLNSKDCLLGGSPTNLFHYSLCLALLQVLLRSPCHALHRQCPSMYTGQFVYCGRRATLSISNVWACTQASSSTAAVVPHSPSAMSRHSVGSSKAPSSATSSTTPATVVPLRQGIQGLRHHHQPQPRQRRLDGGRLPSKEGRNR